MKRRYIAIFSQFDKKVYIDFEGSLIRSGEKIIARGSKTYLLKLFPCGVVVWF